MKIGFYSESPADQAALAVFTEGILGEPPEPISMNLEGHGVMGVLSGLDGVVRGVHYNSDADGLVVVIDCDDTDLHEPEHDTPGSEGQHCRFCEARKIVARARKQLKPRKGMPPLKVAIGLTVPAIEAWYLVGKNHLVGEAAWRVGAVREARRIIIAGVQAIETSFPAGFGPMAVEIRSWRAR
jgi:hypothetical protein